MIKCLIFLLFFFSTAYSSGELKFLPYYPFKIGEKMSLEIHVLGVYIGDQEITIEDVITYQGQRVITGRGHIFTTPVISALYKIDDSEITYFVAEDYVPVFYERWIDEGNWKDNIRFHFYPDEHKVDAAHKVYNYKVDTINYKGVLRNYFTLISCMRGVDYDYYIKNNQSVDISYLYGTAIKNARFKPSYKRINYKGNDLDTIFLAEIGGIGMNFYIQNDENRIPLRLIIPAFQVIGWKTISVYVELNTFKRGSGDISPEDVIPQNIFVNSSEAPKGASNISGKK
jgi:hypothetical protein